MKGRSLLLALGFSVATLATLWLTRSNHPIWSLFNIYPETTLPPFLLRESLLSLFLVPFTYYLLRVLGVSTSRRVLISLITLTALVSESLQYLIDSMTFDLIDVLCLFIGVFLCKRVDQPIVHPKKHNKITSLVLIIPLQWACLLPQNCDDETGDHCDQLTWLTWEEIRVEVVPEYGDTATLTRPGKLLSDDNEMLIVDRYTGFHVFDTSDPQNPMRLAYIPLPGVTDVTTDGTYLYANAFTDIVLFPISALREKSFVPGDEIRTANQLYINQYKFLPEYFYYLTSKDESRLKDGDYGIAIGVTERNDTQWLYGEKTYSPYLNEDLNIENTTLEVAE